MSQTYYALRMLADLNDGDTGKFAPSDNTKNNRAWYRSPNADGPWTLILNSNPDSGYRPTLMYLPATPDKSDQVQFEVYYDDLGPSRHIDDVEILASFGSQKNTNTKLASPFRRDRGNIRTILGLDGITRKPDPDHFLIGPFQVALDRAPNKIKPGEKDTFEFNLVAVFTLLNGEKKEVLEFGYDPEMEVEMGPGPLPPGEYKA